jgi:hypothetical protein
VSDLKDDEIAAFVGKRAGYYLEKWRPALDGTGTAGNATGFNWAACLLSGLWLPYRKMYRASEIFFAILLVEIILEEIVSVGILGKPEAPGSVGSAVGLITAIVCGAFGNAWYLSHTQAAIAEVRSRGLPEDACLQALAKRGGTRFAASLSFLIAFFAAVFVISLLSDLFLKRG